MDGMASSRLPWHGRLARVSHFNFQEHGRDARATRGAQAQRLVFRLCVWTWSPALMGWTTLPMSHPYLMIVSPTLKSRRAILWPSGMLTDARAVSVEFVER